MAENKYKYNAHHSSRKKVKQENKEEKRKE
jgi:hypothetical protein